MGMYSYFVESDIEVKDLKGLQAFFERFVKAFPDNEFLTEILDGNRLSFEKWDGHKLIQYWYRETIVFLECIAKYIGGFAKFRYETDEELAVLYFEDGKFRLELGVVNYNDCDTAALLTHRYSKDDKDNTERKKCQDFLLLEQI